MFPSNDVGVHDTAGGVERVHGGVDTTLGHRPGEDSGGVQVSEGGSGSRVSQVVSRNIDSLDRGDGALLGGGDSLLHATHVSGQSGLVTHSRGNTTQQSRHLGTSLNQEIHIR